MSDNNQSSQDWQRIVNDAKNLFNSITVGIKGVIANYKTASDNKPSESDKPVSPTPPPIVPPKDTPPKPVEAPPKEPEASPIVDPKHRSLDEDFNDNKPENKE